MTNKFWIINLVLFQLAWFSCALLTAQANWILPTILAIHFLLSPKKQGDAKLLPFVLVGAAIDFGLFKLEIIGFQTNTFPLWLICLWAMFIISINHSLYWLRKCKPWLTVIIGALGGSSSYLAAVKFGAIVSNTSFTSLFIIYAVIWALILPILIGYQSRVVKITNT